MPWISRVGCLSVVLLCAACSSTGPQRSPQRSLSSPSFDDRSTKMESLSSPAEQLNQAVQAMQQRNFTEAEHLLRDLIQRQPFRSGPHTNLGILQAKLGQSTEAVQNFRRAVELNRRNTVAWNWLGSLLRAQKDSIGSEQAYLSALAMKPDDPASHLNLAILYDVDMQKPAAALRHYRQYMRLAREPERIVQAWIRSAEDRSGSLTLAEIAP